MISTPRPGISETDDHLKSLQRDDLTRYWTDPDVLLKRAIRDAGRFDFDDSIPALRMPIGPTMLSAFLGSRVEFGPDTVWFHPCTDDLATLEDIAFDPGNPWWQMVESFCHTAAREAKSGGFAPVIPDLGGLGDNLAALIGSDRLLEEMLDRPDLVKKVLRRMLDIQVTCNKRIDEILESAGNGTSSWLCLWSPGSVGILQNDLSIMLSTDMYKEFFAEEFSTLGGLYDDCIFHLDGTACQRHLRDFLLRIPGLHAVQLGSNPGTKAMEVLPAIQMLQKAGKSVFTYVFPDEIEELFSIIPPRGIGMVTSAGTDAEAEDIRRRLNLACDGRS
ncbi:MAG: hypothetical protein PHC88_03325 [Terrimicrobiaceae bacterium]|nr:hypothetical protein [Terrimicrobiaceae bacterium]